MEKTSNTTARALAALGACAMLAAVCAAALAPQEAHAATAPKLESARILDAGGHTVSKSELAVGLCPANGGEARLVLSATPAKAAKKVTWKSGNASTATVKASGKKGAVAVVTVHAEGKCTVKATVKGKRGGKRTVSTTISAYDSHQKTDVAAAEATCTLSGHDAYRMCTLCKARWGYEATAALGHDYVAVPAKAATCTEAGWNLHGKCKRCGDEVNKTPIAPLGHDWVAVAAKAATCTEEGCTTYRRCTRCGEEVGKETVAALGHKWGGWESDGSRHLRQCTRCGNNTEKERHTYGSDGKCTSCGAFGILGKEISVPDYDSTGRFIQGFCVRDDGKRAFVFKQNESRAGNLQRIDLTTGESERMTMSAAAVSAAKHGNGMDWLEANGTPYLLMAPSDGYISVVKLSGKKATLAGKVTVKGSVIGSVNSIAVMSVNGSRATCLVARGSDDSMAEVTVDVEKLTTVSSGKRISGYAGCNQGISCAKVDGEWYVTGCGGGWTDKSARVVKWRLSDGKLKKVWSKTIPGEAQCAAFAPGGLWVAVERETKYNEAHGVSTKDRLVPWTLAGEEVG